MMESQGQEVVAAPAEVPNDPGKMFIGGLSWQTSPDQKTKEELVRKDMKLDDYLKDVYVTSYDPPAIKNPKFAKPSDRDRLPQFRGIVEETELGIVDSEVVPEGKLSLRQAMKILADHQEDPVKNNANSVATQYKIPVPVAENMLSYFASLNVRINNPKEHELKLKDVKMMSTSSRPTVMSIGESVSKLPPK